MTVSGRQDADVSTGVCAFLQPEQLEKELDDGQLEEMLQQGEAELKLIEDMAGEPRVRERGELL